MSPMHPPSLSPRCAQNHGLVVVDARGEREAAVVAAAGVVAVRGVAVRHDRVPDILPVRAVVAQRVGPA